MVVLRTTFTAGVLTKLTVGVGEGGVIALPDPPDRSYSPPSFLLAPSQFFCEDSRSAISFIKIFTFFNDINL